METTPAPALPLATQANSSTPALAASAQSPPRMPPAAPAPAPPLKNAAGQRSGSLGLILDRSVTGLTILTALSVVLGSQHDSRSHPRELLPMTFVTDAR